LWHPKFGKARLTGPVDDWERFLPAFLVFERGNSKRLGDLPALAKIEPRHWLLNF
jgi:hypothetical protein